MITKFKQPDPRVLHSPLKNGNPSYDAAAQLPTSHIRTWYANLLSSTALPSAIVAIMETYLFHPFGVGDLIEIRDPFGKFYVCALLCRASLSRLFVVVPSDPHGVVCEPPMHDITRKLPSAKELNDHRYHYRFAGAQLYFCALPGIRPPFSAPSPLFSPAASIHVKFCTDHERLLQF
jgi:hypothetical protein